jgi:hypothetical protein
MQMVPFLLGMLMLGAEAHLIAPTFKTKTKDGILKLPLFKMQSARRTYSEYGLEMANHSMYSAYSKFGDNDDILPIHNYQVLCLSALICCQLVREI